MSDYLWDKTGEPDAEVERLEAMLGGFGHAPRPLALPAQAAPHVLRPSRLFATAGLAAAAALLLASTLGAFVLLRSRAATEEKDSAASETRQTRPDARRGKAGASSEPARGAADGLSKDEKAGVLDEKGAVVDFKRVSLERKGVRLASMPRRRQRLISAARLGPAAGAAPALESMSALGGAPTLFESTRLMAKEQLVYALRLTGAKLRDVRLKTRGREGSEPPAGVRAPVR